MKDSLITILKSFVDFPDDVKVDEQTYTDGSINLLATVNPEDMGKVIGKEGKIIRALRNLVKVLAVKHNARVFFNLSE